MNEKPTYRFEIKAKRTGKKIKHFMNKDDFGFYCNNDNFAKMTDERIKDIAWGIVFGLMNDKEIYVEVYKLNEQGGYDLIRTQF
jgi:hypothetical protein